MNLDYEPTRARERELRAYKEAFEFYDWYKSGVISVKVINFEKMFSLFLVAKGTLELVGHAHYVCQSVTLHKLSFDIIALIVKQKAILRYSNIEIPIFRNYRTFWLCSI